MSRLKKIFQVGRGFMKTLVHRVFPNNVLFSGLLLLAPNVCLDISARTNVSIGNMVTVESGTAVAARENSKLYIGNHVYINRNCTITARDSITLEDGVTIGPNCCIYDHDHDLQNPGSFVTKPIVIGRDTWSGAGCIILKGVTVGRKCVIAAGTIVTKDVPDSTLLRGQTTYVSKSLLEFL